MGRNDRERESASERESERENERNNVCIRLMCVGEGSCVSVYVRDNVYVCVCVCVCVCITGKQCTCGRMCVRKMCGTQCVFFCERGSEHAGASVCNFLTVYDCGLGGRMCTCNTHVNCILKRPRLRRIPAHQTHAQHFNLTAQA